MNIKVLYFSRIKESVNYSTEDLVLPAGIQTINALKNHLAARGETWEELFDGKQLVRAAINHELVEDVAVISEGDEVAFFPPVTGG